MSQTLLFYQKHICSSSSSSHSVKSIEALGPPEMPGGSTLFWIKKIALQSV